MNRNVDVGVWTSKLFETIGEYPLPKGYVFAPTYWQAAATAGLLFLLVLTLGQLRRRFIGWQLGGVLPGVSFGFALALILEGILIVGGRTILTELVGWKNAPGPIVNVLDAGRNRLVDVLGVSDEIPASNAGDEDFLIEDVVGLFGNLSSAEQEEVKQVICEP